MADLVFDNPAYGPVIKKSFLTKMKVHFPNTPDMPINIE